MSGWNRGDYRLKYPLRPLPVSGVGVHLGIREATVKPVRTRLGAALAAMTLGASALVVMGGTANALTDVPYPQLTFDHTISSRPFSGAPSNAVDIEGLAAVSASSMWVADDNSDSLWQINPSSGAYISRLRGGATKDVNGQPLTAYPDFASATEVGSGLTCGQLLNPAVVGDTAANECLSRTDDFESVLYDGSGAIYAISGIAPSQTLAGTPANPTVWKLTDTGSGYTPTSFQQLPQTEDPTAAGWRPGTGLYFGKGTKLKTYDFAGNTLGSTFSIGLSDIVGVTFPDANTAFVTTARSDTSAGRTTATSDSTIRKFTVSGSTFTQATTWTFPLASIGNAALGVDNAGMIDARDLAIVGDTFYVSDGYDGRASGDHPIYVYTLGSAPALTAGFTAAQQTTSAPYTVQFFDTTTPTTIATPRTWAWDLDGNGTTDSTVQNPTFGYGATGTYNVTLTVTNAAGPSSITKPVKVSPGTVPPGPAWRYESLNGSGSNVTNNHFGGGNTLLQYGSQLHGFYRDTTTTSSLDHSWWDGAKWNYEKLDTSGGSVGNNVASIVYNGQLQLFYTDSTGTHLTHRWWDGARWNSEAFDATKLAGSGTIAVKLYGTQLQLFYANDSSQHLRHSWYDGAWHSEDLDTGTALPSSNTSVDASKYGATLQVVFKTFGNALRHGWYSGGWNFETLDGTGSTTAGQTNNSVGDYAQLQSFGTQLDILYRDASANGLRHAWWNGAKWSFELLDGTGGNIPGQTNNSVGSYIAAMQYGGGLHVWYRDLTSGALRHAWYASGWHVEVLDGTGATNPGSSNSGDTGRFTAVVDYFGQIQLTYLDAGNSDRLAHSWYS